MKLKYDNPLSSVAYNFNLRPYSAELRFNDAPWLAAPEGVRLAHPKLAASTAEAVGVRSLRLALLAESSEELGLQLHGRGVQVEPVFPG